MTTHRKPKAGDIVLFTGPQVFNGTNTYPAIVTQVFEGAKYANLKVLPPFVDIFDEGSVSHHSEMYEGAGRYWAWPDEEHGEKKAHVPAEPATGI